MPKSAYFIRCDSSAIIGSGHVMRCIRLAQKLANKASEITFLCRDLSGSLHHKIEKAGFNVIIIPAEEGDSDYSITQSADAQSVLAIIKQHENATLIVDHYALTKEWQTIVRHNGRLIVIDDLADRPHDCDVIINQNYYPQGPQLYSGLITGDVRLWTGPHYALLADDFAMCRHASHEQNIAGERVVIFFGSADMANLTKMATIAAVRSNRFAAIDIIAGDNHPDIDSLKEIAHTHKHVKLHPFIDNFAAFLSGANLMIGAGGVTQLERCCLGIPGIIISIADNQTTISQNLHDRGCALYLGWYETVTEHDVLESINTLYAAPLARQAMSTICRSMVDGLGTSRVASMLLAPQITLRPASIRDGETMHRWRNHPSVREHSGNPEPIPLGPHMTWLEETLSNPQLSLLIGEANGSPFGVLRFDFKEKNAVISIYTDPQSIGQGMGYGLLETGKHWLQKHRPQTKLLQATIHDKNARSIRTFTKAGFNKRGEFYELDI